MGSIERFLSVLIEHVGGNFPLWLSPVQVVVLPISDAHLAYAEKVAELLNNSEIRVKLDRGGDSLGKKIRSAKIEKIPYTVVIGDAEVAKEVVTLESRDLGKVGEFSLPDLIKKFTQEITTKK